ncbi:PEP-CTERM sorting domain-containing protein [Prosthecobacter dejongeii]|uniref:PEP-CTERM protein-sorting domain-containing protein n=1 Tax=Prosthecobacter dejongeii TaxID=48465 RepID=A0A7W7YM17_9BACT|nr:PEP-CTERM sorting domain-containing protein [Prosthecobacter dejongeii]MBB5038487.1 hypothetical protein [Prosthecobacter dejongeii]
MRAVFYWLFSIALAGLAARASEHSDKASQLLWDSSVAADALPVPEPSRAILLSFGIMAIAFTYRQAWLNWKRKD